jgi:Fe2+ or Zn2+ uptake regulation protein
MTSRTIAPDLYRRKSQKELSEAGLRATNQRAVLLEIIRDGEGHLDAYELYRRARKRQPGLSLSTVYRTLQQFKKLGLVDEVHFNEAHHHYETKHSDEHHHLVCLDCGKVIEFNYPLSQHIKKKVPEAGDFDITEIEVRLGGHCSECKKRK